MGKVLIVFYSEQCGDTKEMAETIAEGVKEGGAEIDMANTNERRITLDEFRNADALAIGTPD